MSLVLSFVSDIFERLWTFIYYKFEFVYSNYVSCIYLEMKFYCESYIPSSES